MTQQHKLIYIVGVVAWLLFRFWQIGAGDAPIVWSVVFPIIGLVAASSMYMREALR